MRVIYIVCLLFLCCLIQAQDELKWKDEIESLTNKEVEEVEDAEGLLLITGSSSARFWLSFADDFPEYTTINNGFGGSKMHELLYFLEELVINYEPDIVLIYEGDNDLAAGMEVNEIMTTTEQVVKRIDEALPNTAIYFISPKPSLARWNLKDQYVELNNRMKSYCEDEAGLEYIDVWYPMLNEDGTPMKDIFISDGLHMNKKGYEIWKRVVRGALNKL